MNATNAIKKLVKAGFAIDQTSGNFFNATRDTNVISFFVQQGETICIKIRSKNDKDCAMTDYSAGIFCSTVTQAIKLAY